MQDNEAQRLRLLLAPDVHAPARARRALRELPLGEREGDVLLLASELVTNAVVHGGLGSDAPIELEAACERGHARVEVRDGGHGFTRAPQAGHGLRLVDAATDRWGIDQHGGTRVWFELPVREMGRKGRKPAETAL